MTVDFEALPHPGIQTLIPYKPGKSIEELMYEKGLTDIIKLASNENPLGCSPLALEAIQNLPSKIIATYPSPINHRLMPTLAKQLTVAPEQLFISNGSDYLFGMLLQSFALHTSKHMLTHEYAFSTYAIQAQTLNIPVRTVPVDKNWAVQVDWLIESCTKDTALIFLANPNNPTGLLIPQEDIKRLLENIPSSTLLVIDEAYYEYAAAFFSCNSIDWLEEHSNLVITRTFSKLYGLAGLRLGYALTHPDIITILKRVQLPFAVNQVAMAAGEAALFDSDFITKTLTNNQEGIKQMRAGLEELGLNYLPGICNFLTFSCKEDSLNLYHYLLDQGIILRPLHPYQMQHYLRATIGTTAQNTRLLQALRNYYEIRSKY